MFARLIPLPLTWRAGVAVSVAALAVLSFGVHSDALRNGLAYDDVTLILGDARIQSLANVRSIFASGYWLDPDLALYRPLTTLTFALNYAAAGSHPGLYHLTNLLLHTAAVIILFVLLRHFLPACGALVGSAIFAVHPVHVEAIANVAGRAEVLAAVLVLLACLIWIRSSRDDMPAASTWLVPPLFLFGLLAKESAVVLPALLVLLDVGAGRLRRQRLREYIRVVGPAMVAMGAALVLYLALRHNALDVLVPTKLDPALSVLASPLQRTLTALQAWPQFARLLFMPVTLLADYGPGVIVPATTLRWPAIAGFVILATTIAMAVGLLLRRRYGAAIAPVWFLIAIAPVSNLLLPIGVLVAERTLYLPSAALAFGAGFGFVTVTRNASAPAFRAIVVAVVGVVTLGAMRSAQRVPEWRSTETIFAAQLRDRPDSFRAHWIDARRLRGEADAVAAVAAYARALELWPYGPQLGLEAAAFAVQHGDLPFAHAVAGQLARNRPLDLVAQRLLAAIALDVGDTVSARAAMARGLTIDPDDPLLRRMFGALNPAGSQ